MDRTYSKEDIGSLLKRLDSKIDENIEIIAIGGTALSLLGERFYSRDVDICYVSCRSPSEFAQAVIDAGKDVGINSEDIEIFHGFEMSLLNIPEFNQRAVPYHEFQFKHIFLKIMNLVDLALSKIDRSEPKDIDDVKQLLDNGLIRISDLEDRFHRVLPYQPIDVRVKFNRKYESFIKNYKSIRNK